MHPEALGNKEKKIFSQLKNFNDFCLAGGTALALQIAIGRRGTYKDYVDLYFILYEKRSSLNEILEISEKKFGNEFNGRLFLEQLIYLEDIEDTNIIFLKNKPDKEVIKKFFTEEIRKIKL